MADGVKLVRLISPNGAEVEVSAEKAERLIGYTKVPAQTAPKSTSSK